jgi:hypothetical protein
VTRAFLDKRFKGFNPSVLHADFNGDGHLDYAMLLKSDNSEAAKLVVLLSDAHAGHCRSVYELDINTYSETAYLSRLRVGTKVAQAGDADEEQSHPIKLQTSGIELTYFEKGRVVLYWDKKLQKIIEIGTSD